MTKASSKPLAGLTFQVSSLSALAAVCMFLGDLLVASLLGVSTAADAFFVASTMPAILIGLFNSVGGALVPVFVPTNHLSAKVENLYATVFNIILLSMPVVVVLGILFAPTLVAITSPGVSAATAQLATVLLRIVFPTAFFSGLAAILVGMLNAHQQFTYAALSSLVRAVATLISIMLLSGYGAVGIGVGWVLGGLIQLIVMLGICRWRGVFRYRLYLDWNEPSLKAAWTLARTALWGMGTNQIAAILEKVIASFLPAGTISALSYATRIVRGSGQVLVGAVAQISLPGLAAKSDKNLLDDAYRLFIRNLRFVMYLTFPLSTVLMSLSLPLSTLLLQRGVMTATQVSRIAPLFSLASIGLVFSGFYEMCLMFLYAQRRVKTLNRFYAIFLGAFVIWGGSIGWHEEGRGLALVYPLSILTSALYGLWALNIPRFYRARMVIYVIQLAVAGLAVGGSVLGVTMLLPPVLKALPAVVRTSLILFAGLMNASAVWIGMTALLRVSETLRALQYAQLRLRGRS